MTPINSKKIQKKLSNLLDIYWKDNTKSWLLQNDGTYLKREVENQDQQFSAQDYLLSKNNQKKNDL